MSLKINYFILIGLIHILLGICLYTIFKENKIYFILSELGILILFSLSVILFQNMMKPMKLIKSGKDAITDGDFTVKFVKTGLQETDSLISIYNEMIESLRKEQTRTVEQSYFLEKLINISPIGIVILDYEDRISEINDKAKKLLNINQNWKQKFLTQFSNPLIPEILQLSEGSKAMFTPSSFQKYRCQLEQIIHKGFPRKFIIIEDLTAEIMASEKQAYEKVIRMMAHEVNNSMGAINSILQTVSEFGFEHEGADLDLKDSLSIAVNRNKNLAKFIDKFADIIRLPEPNLNQINFNKLVYNTVQAWKIVAKRQNIQLEFSESNYPEQFIQMDASQIERVLSNALKNSIESIQENGNITVKILTNPIGFSVTDNGPGIDINIKNQLFTPFFSTKTNGQGIGLMLSKEIIENHNGNLQLFTDPNDGLTYFIVKFDH